MVNVINTAAALNRVQSEGYTGESWIIYYMKYYPMRKEFWVDTSGNAYLCSQLLVHSSQ